MVIGPAVGMILACLILVSCSTPSPTQGGVVATGSAPPSGTAGHGPSRGASPSATTTPGSGCSSGESSPAPGPKLEASPTAPALPSSNPGTITGTAGWPPSGVSPQLIYAISTAGASHGAYSTETVAGQFSYTIKGVAPGEYYVFSAVRPLVCKGQGTVLGAPYSVFATCGSPSCSHAPLQVIVKAGVTTARIDPGDWYTSDKTVPAPPIWVVPSDPPLPSAGQTYASAREAAAATARVHAAAVMVDSMATCPVNRACISVGTEHDGTEAAHFNGEGGSNADVLACMTYVVHDQAGWRGVRSQCPATFPAVGQSGMVWLGGVTASCGANVRSSPGAQGRVVACLQHHTPVSIDYGPVYAPMSSMDGIWWHLAGQGWMADDLLIYPEICGCD
jgi:hypothetical protein